LAELYSIYESAAPIELSGGLGYLLDVYDDGAPVLARVIRILSDRCKSDSKVGVVLSQAFEGSSDLGKRVIELLSSDVDLFSKAYIAACEAAPGTDYRGELFNALLDLDPQFPAMWVRSLLDKRRHNEHGDYSFIWKRADHINIVTRTLDELLAHSEPRFDIYDVAEMLFRTRLQGEEKRILNDRQDTFLDNIIKDRNTDRELMSLLFLTISEFAPNRRRARIATFLSHNKDFDEFSRIAIEPSSYSLNVQAFRNRIVFLTSLLPLMNCLDLLRHRQRIEQRIRGIERDIEQQSKEDFMEYGPTYQGFE
jgi:hypothetical protein